MLPIEITKSVFSDNLDKILFQIYLAKNKSALELDLNPEKHLS